MAQIDPGTALGPTQFIDSDHPEIRAFAAQACDGGINDRDKAVRLYNAVRDQVRYDCYQLDFSREGLSASVTLRKGFGFCVPKAVLLAAVCRAEGIPAALGFADVRNHLSTPRLEEIMGSDIFYHHGYTAIYLDGRWIKATPAFNRSLCEKSGIPPLEFDGFNDSIFHAYDNAGQQHMEYLRYHGETADMPYQTFIDAMAQHYPNLMKLADHDWDSDVQAMREG
ncbi:MAG: transglutaminase family protein [Novosphingobium sp.]|nr:transglutaminase family protein [Novosphingobium sp.]MCP5389872.1 transglutaminase family protein [Novosphingobium sp.]